MVDFKALVPWRDKTNTPAPREEYRDPFPAFRREVDRMFDDFFSGFGRCEVDSMFGTPTPSMDLTENDKEIVVTAELPGLDGGRGGPSAGPSQPRPPSSWRKSSISVEVNVR